MTFSSDRAAYLLGRDRPVVLDVLGPTIEILTEAVDDPSAPTLLRGTIPPGGVVPVHAHEDPETFLVLSGDVEGLVYPADSDPRWVPVRAGQVFHVPPGARHALRNTGDEPNVALVISTPQMAEFFTAIGEPIDAPDAPRQPPDPGRLLHMQQESAARGYWNATPEQNSGVGIDLPPAP